MSNSGSQRRTGEPPADGGSADDHLAGVEDGCGCVEVWEFLSERRSSD